MKHSNVRAVLMAMRCENERRGCHLPHGKAQEVFQYYRERREIWRAHLTAKETGR